MSSNVSTFCHALGDKQRIAATASAALLVEHVMQGSTSKQAHWIMVQLWSKHLTHLQVMVSAKNIWVCHGMSINDGIPNHP